MAEAFVCGSTCKAFLDGTPLIHGRITINRTQMSYTKETFDGEFLAPGIGKITITIDQPVFAASPLEVVETAQRLTAKAGLLTVTDVVNDTTRAFHVMIDESNEDFDPKKASDQTWKLNVGGPMLKA